MLAMTLSRWIELTVLFAFCLLASSTVGADQALKDVGACDSEIYCDGPVLQAVQDAHVYNDSKTFVDLNMLHDPDKVLSAFGNLTDKTDGDAVKRFVEANFDGPATEFTSWTPTDWKPSPSMFSNIRDTKLRAWASDLNDLWKDLGRKITDDVKNNAQRYSLMSVDNPFVVPGGRFREFYYWDSYWIIKGLLLSEMTNTVKGMLLNFASIVDKLGFVPNGNRVYYERRSQPPFLIPSVSEYLKATGDFPFVQSILPSLQREYEFWMANRSVDVTRPGSSTTHTLNRYNVFMGKPRPESYREDVETASGLPEAEAAEVYSNLASAAESGWDFSGRWFGEQGTLRSIRTKEIVPVDLNSVLCLNEKLLADFYERAGNATKAAEFSAAHQARRAAIRDIFWSDATGAWLDYDLKSSANNNKFYLSSIVPMWVGCYGEDAGKKEEIDRAVINYLKREGVLDHPGGVPTSKQNTGQQWDYPNAWPPLQHMLIEALANSSLEEAKQLAFDLAQKWTLTNYRAYEENQVMYEKYDVTNQGVPGHGGEYGVQAGFGWTNGVILTLLDTYGDRLQSDVPTTTHPPTTVTSASIKPRLYFSTLILILSLMFILLFPL
ncbi:trehalase-like [Acanthaster planci]|uniref:Trehalase n=1 Tax=Acanthaster planci TaxID=133434 RepID=A0A8B7ZS08_ACAPL|nr:trehalase-like [Acanthaster planci]